MKRRTSRIKSRADCRPGHGAHKVEHPSRTAKRSPRVGSRLWVTCGGADPFATWQVKLDKRTQPANRPSLVPEFKIIGQHFATEATPKSFLLVSKRRRNPCC